MPLLHEDLESWLAGIHGRSPEHSLWASVVLRAVLDLCLASRRLALDPGNVDCVSEVEDLQAYFDSEARGLGSFCWIAEQLFDDHAGMVEKLRVKLKDPMISSFKLTRIRA